MNGTRASLSALLSAYLRAHHALNGSPRVFDDFLAPQLFSPEEHAFFSQNLANTLPVFAPEHPSTDPASDLDAVVHAQLVPLSRSRFAEDRLAATRGASQYVVLGAGYDTFAFRRPEALEGLKVFEVDHPATQQEKRERLSRLGWQAPEGLCFVPLDFTRDDLASVLVSAGFEPERPAFFSWLGVCYYLPRPTVLETFAAMARLAAPGSAVVFDYMDPDAFDPARAVEPMRRLHGVMQRTGEPMVTGFDPEELASELARVGLRLEEDLGAEAIAERYFEGHPHGFSAFAHLRFARAIRV